MKNLIFILVAALLVGCAGSRKVNRAPETPPYHPIALNHIIDGAVLELLDMPKEALFHYHQAAEIDSASPGIYTALAENYYRLQKPEVAASLARKALRLDPQNIEALTVLGLCCEAMENYTEAMSVYERLVKLRPNDKEPLYYLTVLQLINNKPKEASASYRRLRALGLDDPDALMDLARFFQSAGRGREAEQIYLELQQNYPELEKTYLAAAEAAEAQGDTLRAVRMLEEALLQHPSFEDVKEELLTRYERRRDAAAATALFEKLVERDSSDTENVLQLGRFYLVLADTGRAEALYRRLAQRQPLSERAHTALAVLQLTRGDTTAAESTCLKGLEQRSNFYRLRALLRDIYAEQKKWDAALALYEPLKDNDTTYVGARIEIAKLLMQKGDTLAAISTVEPLTDTHPDDWRVPITLGRFYQMSNNPQAALKQFNRAEELRKDMAEIPLLRALTYLNLDSLAAAEAVLDEASKRFQQDAAIHYYLGFVNSRQGRTRRAAQYYQKSLELDPSNHQTALALAGALDELRQYDRAETLYQKLLQNNPDSPIVLNNYAYHLAVQAVELEKALSMAQKAVAAVPKSASYLDTLGWIYYQMGDYEKAREYIEASLREEPNNAEVNEHLGDVLEKLGQRNAALELWRKALQLDDRRVHLLDKIGADVE